MIRSFTIDDIESIYALGNQITSNFSKTNPLLEIYQNPYTKILVYEKEKKVIAFLMYTELEDVADILDIIVEEKFRHQNIASCLLDSMISELKETVKLLTLEVSVKNTAAIAFYQKFGFEVVNVREKYYQNGEDAYLMGRRLEK